MQDNTAKVIATVGIWLCFSVILTFGVFRVDWHGDSSLFALVVVVFLLSAAAGISTVAVWGQFAALREKLEKSRQPAATNEKGN